MVPRKGARRPISTMTRMTAAPMRTPGWRRSLRHIPVRGCGALGTSTDK